MVGVYVHRCASDNKIHTYTEKKHICHVSPQFAFTIYLNMSSVFKIYCHICEP